MLPKLTSTFRNAQNSIREVRKQMASDGKSLIISTVGSLVAAGLIAIVAGLIAFVPALRTAVLSVLISVWNYLLSSIQINVAILFVLIVCAILIAARILFILFSVLKGRRSIESVSRFVPHAIPPGIGNAYLRDSYINPPSGTVTLGGAQFLLKPDSIIFDTNKAAHYYLPRRDGGKEVEFPLPGPVNGIKAVHFLINSGNSQTIYAQDTIGKIRLIFKDAPPIVVPLVLGENIREWCPGNSGEFVRETTSPSLLNAWLGMSKSGAIAVIDCLRVPVFECMRNCLLEKIIFVHIPVRRQPDTLGVQFLVSGVSLEIEHQTQN